MIALRLYGGLGNQLFQYAMGRQLALRFDTTLVLDLAWYHRAHAGGTARPYELSRYPIAARIAHWGERPILRMLRGRAARLVPGWTCVRERGFDYDPNLGALEGNCYVDGYWQSDRYFQGIADLLRTELNPRLAPAPADEKVQRQILAANAVSVHVRRGDYVSSQTAAAHHGTSSGEYYAAALAAMAASIENPHFFVFSDDMAWTRRHLSIPGPVSYVDHNGPEAAFQDLRLMSTCRHHIIANSSFSWWGAWLNPNRDKRVVAPRHWFADGRPTTTLMPPDWIRL